MKRRVFFLVLSIISTVTQLLFMMAGILALHYGEWGKASAYFLFVVMLRLQGTES